MAEEVEAADNIGGSMECSQRGLGHHGAHGGSPERGAAMDEGEFSLL